MGDEVGRLLELSDRLSAPEKEEVVAAILRCSATQDLPPLDDETITQIANESFLEYDARESAEERATRERESCP